MDCIVDRQSSLIEESNHLETRPGGSGGSFLAEPPSETPILKTILNGLVLIGVAESGGKIIYTLTREATGDLNEYIKPFQPSVLYTLSQNLPPDSNGSRDGELNMESATLTNPMEISNGAHVGGRRKHETEFAHSQEYQHLLDLFL